MTDIGRLAEIRERADKATPGPWVPRNCAEEKDAVGWWWVWQESKLPYYGGVMELDRKPDGTAEFNGGHLGHAAIEDNQDDAQERADAEFIANARSDIPWLLDRIAQQRREVLEEVMHALRQELRNYERPSYEDVGFDNALLYAIDTVRELRDRA